jgi:ankyrin repeat protein
MQPLNDLLLAMTSLKIQKAHSIIKKRPELINEIHPEFLPPLLLAAKLGENLLVEAMVDAGADVRQVDDLDRTALHLVAQSERGWRVPIAALLVKEGADINAVSDQQTTPIMVAAEWGNFPVFTYLYALGARLDGVNAKGFNIAEIADREYKQAKPREFDGYEQIGLLLHLKGVTVRQGR